MSFISKIFGDANAKELKKLQPLVDKINELEPNFKSLSDEDLKAKTKEFKERLKKDESLDDLLPEAFATVREAAKRVLGQRHYDVQLLGGVVLHQGKIAEMKTGEGKTLTSTCPVYLNALEGKGVHVITVNDYLARRDADWMGRVYNFLGLSVGCVQNQLVSYVFDPQVNKEEEDETEMVVKVDMENLKPVSRPEAYQVDITYGTNNEFGFDYLRDNMVQDSSERAQRGLHYGIIDEVDSILIDEARTPLIISSPAEEATDQYQQYSRLVNNLEENKDYNIDEKMRAATLTEQGITNMEKALGMDNIYEAGGVQIVHHIEQALKARTLFKRDTDYVVKDGEVIIVDEFTGRLMQGRRFSEGLHQAIEAKENLEIKQESRTLATVTFQNLFRMYKKLSGMTGTAVTEAEEFHKIYKLDVLVAPTNKPLAREDLPDSIFKTEKGKYLAVAKKIKELHKKGQPVLVGTISIEKNELLGELLEREGVPHKLLNAKNHEKEAEIIAQAGKKGAVTVATNMAGRGVDIILSGNPPNKQEAEQIKEVGGLVVIGTERHEARRIDNQLRGRSGRQGDPGVTQFYVSMDDDLMRIFGSDRMKSMMTTLKVPEDMPIENSLVSRALESAQGKVEGRNFDTREHLVKYDDVINKHREVIYKKRLEVLLAKKEDLRKIQYQQYTVSLIDKLRTKFNVIIDYQLFDRINIISPRPEDNDKILIRSDKSVVPVSYFIEQCKKENSLGRSDLNNKDQQDQLKKRVINIMVSNSIVMWEALDRHYEEFSPLKEDYKFTKEYNVVKELERRLYKEIHVSQEEIARYYNDNKSSFTKPVELRLVLVEGSKKDIKSLWTQVISGSQIIKSASQLNLPVKITSQQATNYDQLSTEVAKVVKALKPGELSRPIAGKNLYSLIKLEKRHAETIKKIDQVRTLISKTIIKNKQVEIKKQFIQKLAQNSDIITNTDLWDMVIKKYTD